MIDGAHGDSLSRLFDHLFKEPSRDLIKSSFRTLQQSAGELLNQLCACELSNINEYLMMNLINPLHQLFVDLGDLEYQDKY